MHWNPWLGNVSQVHQEPFTGQPNPYMEMFHEELCMQNLPENVKIVETHLPTGRHRGVFSGQRRIAKGTRFGPYTGNIVLPVEMRSPEKNSVWEVNDACNYRLFPPRLIEEFTLLSSTDKDTAVLLLKGAQSRYFELFWPI